MKKYYSTQRPVMPGSFPKTKLVEKIVNFDSRQFVEEIGREAWGYIIYRELLEPQDAESYELLAVE